jgi:hypothetical protein
MVSVGRTEFPQGRFAPWAEAQGLHSLVKAKHLKSEPFEAQDKLKLRPPKKHL